MGGWLLGRIARSPGRFVALSIKKYTISFGPGAVGRFRPPGVSGAVPLIATPWRIQSMSSSDRSPLASLIADLSAGHISRRSFIAGAGSLGFSAALAGAVAEATLG